MYGFVDDDGYIGYVMDYYPRGNLKSFLLNSNIIIDPLLQLQLCCDIANGLKHIHQALKPEFHCNIGPKYILLSQKLQVKLIAFQDLTLADETRNPVYRQPVTFDALYRAPEWIENKCRDVYKADVFTVGLVMHMILSRGLPCPENEAEISKLRKKLMSGLRPELEAIQTIKSVLQKGRRHNDFYIIQFLEEVMKACWEQDWCSRLSATELCTTLNHELFKYNASILAQHTKDTLKTMPKRKITFDDSESVPLSKVLQGKLKRYVL